VVVVDGTGAAGAAGAAPEPLLPPPPPHAESVSSTIATPIEKGRLRFDHDGDKARMAMERTHLSAGQT
jgi:hypothetical protein